MNCISLDGGAEVEAYQGDSRCTEVIGLWSWMALRGPEPRGLDVESIIRYQTLAQLGTRQAL